MLTLRSIGANLSRGKRLEAILSATRRCESTQRHSTKAVDTVDEAPKKIIATPDRLKKDPVLHGHFSKVGIRCEYHGVQPLHFNDDTVWLPVYKFPFIRSVRRLIKAQIYLSFASLVISIRNISYCVYDPTLGLFFINFLSASSVVALAYIGNFFRQMVCHIYTTDDANFVRLARLTFFGKRMDMIMPRSVIVPLSETNQSARSPYVTLKTMMPPEVDLKYDTYEFYDETFRIVLRFGGVLDKARFSQALGGILDKKT